MTTTINYHDKLIANDAPLPMMFALAGMGSKQYMSLRKKYGLGKIVLEPKVPTAEVEDAVWHELKFMTTLGLTTFGAEQFDNLYNALDKKVSLRVIWNLFYKWERTGNIKVNRGPFVNPKLTNTEA